jgi:arsenite methyltransferase
MLDYLEHRLDLDQPDTAALVDELSFWGARFGLLLFRHLALRGHLRILDVGCANGFPLFELAHVSGPSCRLVGVDIWQAALRRARWKQTVYQLPNVQLAAADGGALPFPAATFDLIVSNLGINNFDQPQAVLAECFRVARPGARIALTTNLQGHMAEFYVVFRETLQERGDVAALERLAVNEAHRGTRDSTAALLQAAGFAVTKIVEDSFDLCYLDGSAFFRHSLTRIGFLPAWRQVVAPAEETSIFTLLEERLNALAARQGELRLTVPMLYIEGQKPAAG